MAVKLECTCIYLAALQLEGLLRRQLVLLEHTALCLEQRVSMGQRHSQRQPVIWVVICDNPIIQKKSPVGLRATPCLDRLTSLVAPVCNQLHLPRLFAILQHGLRSKDTSSHSSTSRLFIAPCSGVSAKFAKSHTGL